MHSHLEENRGLSEEAQKALDGLYLVSGSGHPELAQRTAKELGVELGQVTLKTFDDDDQYVRFPESVRDKDVVIIQSHVRTPTHGMDKLVWQTLLMTQAARLSSAKSVTVVMPKPAYDRGDRMAKPREAVPVDLFLRTLDEVAQAKRVVVVDIHNPVSLNSFNGPRDPMTAQDIIFDALRERINGRNDEFTIVAADSGSWKVSENASEALGVDLTYSPKTRERSDSAKVRRPPTVPGVEGLHCIIVDDQVSTGTTMRGAADVLKDSGAADLTIAATHGLFVKNGLELLDVPFIKEIIVTDSVPPDRAKAALGDKLTVESIAPLLAQTILQIITGGSVTEIFKGKAHH